MIMVIENSIGRGVEITAIIQIRLGQGRQYWRFSCMHPARGAVRTAFHLLPGRCQPEQLR